MSEKTNKALYIGLSLLIAIAFWLYVDNEQGNTTTASFEDVPVEFIGESDTLPSRGLMLSEGMDATVDLVLRGPRSVIAGLSKRDLCAQVNLTGISAIGTYPLRYDVIYPDNVNSDKITVERRSVSTITVRVIEMFSKAVPVEVLAEGSVADGYIYMLDRQVVEPSTITVSGREEDVEAIAKAQITLNLDGLNTTIRRDFDYELLTAEGEPANREALRVSNRQVSVTAPIYLLKTLDLTVKWIESPGSRLKDVDWDLSVKSIVVAGDPETLANRTSILLGEVDLSAYPMGDPQNEIELDIPIPADCVNNSGVTKTKLTFQFSDNLTTRPVNVTNIVAKGLSQGQKFRCTVPSVMVLLRGPKDELESLLEENVQIVVDLTQYADDGNLSVPGTVLIDGSENIGSVGAATVPCQITSS